MIESPASDYGKIDAWELCTELEYSDIKVSPSDADYFLHLLFSHSSDRVGVEETNSVDNWVHLHLTGPRARDSVHFPLGVEFRGKRLTANFKLSRDDLFSHLPEEGDRDAFVGRLWELGYNKERIDLACKALGLRKLNHS